MRPPARICKHSWKRCVRSCSRRRRPRHAASAVRASPRLEGLSVVSRGSVVYIEQTCSRHRSATNNGQRTRAVTTPKRRFLEDLTDGENLDEVYLVGEKQLRANRQGNLYIQLQLRDRTGS